MPTYKADERAYVLSINSISVGVKLSKYTLLKLVFGFDSSWFLSYVVEGRSLSGTRLCSSQLHRKPIRDEYTQGGTGMIKKIISLNQGEMPDSWKKDKDNYFDKPPTWF
mgnify:CR=1 FL=1